MFGAKQETLATVEEIVPVFVLRFQDTREEKMKTNIED
jgi:hypothetical protein